MKKIRVAFLCDRLEAGGQEKVCLDLLRALSRRRFSPHVYSFLGGSFTKQFRATRAPLFIAHRKNPLSRSWTTRDAAARLRYRETLARRLRRDRIDVAINFAWIDGVEASRRAGVRVQIEKLDGPGLLGKIQDKRPFAAVVSESNTIRRLIERKGGRFGCRPAQLRTIHNGVETQRFWSARRGRARARGKFGIGPDEIAFGFSGRLAPEKNLPLLIQAFALLKEARLNATPVLRVLGPDGGELGKLRRLVRRLKLERRVRFFAYHEDVAPFLSALDAFVITSETEGTPTAMLEAMAAGLPVVATRAGSIPEIVRGNGLLCGHHPRSVALGLRKLARDAALRRKMGRQSRRLARRYSLQAMARSYERLILRLTSV